MHTVEDYNTGSCQLMKTISSLNVLFLLLWITSIHVLHSLKFYFLTTNKRQMQELGL